MNLKALRTALVATLHDVNGLRAYPYEIDQIPAGEATVAIVTIGEQGIDYQQAFRGGLAIVDINIELHVQASSERAATERMDDLLSSGSNENRSVIDALHRNRTLDGLVGGMVVLSASRPVMETENSNQRRLVSELSLRIPVGRL